MKCLVCGHIGQESDRFCSACGAHLGASTERTGLIPLVEQTPNPHDDTSSHSFSQEELASLSNGAAQLVVRSGPLEGVRFSLPTNRESVITIGRSADNDIFLDDVTVSRKHAQFEFLNMQWIIKDEGSLNGTYVNNQRVNSQALNNNDVVQIGKYRFTFVVGTGEDS